MTQNPLSFPPRGLSRIEAAAYVGVGTTMFDEMVTDHRMPMPRRIGRRTVWDRIELDMAFTELPTAENGLHDLLERSRQQAARQQQK